MVEEDEYRSTYRTVNQRRCVFEKAILRRRCSCVCSARFYLADREGIACSSAPAQKRCSQFLALLRKNARFALKIKALDDELPHAKEIKVQNGGLLGLQRVLQPGVRGDVVSDVARLTALGEQTYGSLEQLPYRKIVQSIAQFEGRRRPRSRR